MQPTYPAVSSMWLRTLCIANMILAISASASHAQSQNALLLRCDEAANYLGKSGIVCGTLTQGIYRPDVRGEPTFLNCGGRYPSQRFTWLIWGDRRGSYNPPPESFQGNCVCGYGAIKEFRGKPEIVYPDPIYQARTDDEKSKCK